MKQFRKLNPHRKVQIIVSAGIVVIVVIEFMFPPLRNLTPIVGCATNLIWLWER